MEYIWQYDKDTRYHVDEFPFSPYLEVSYSHAHEVGVNPLLRFHRIFMPLLQACQDVQMNVSERQCIEDCLFHILAFLDRQYGIHYFSLQEKHIEQDLCDGFYGKNVYRMYQELERFEQAMVGSLLRQHIAGKGRQSYFRQAVQSFFPGSRLYYETREKKLLICIPYAVNEKRQRRMNLLKNLFFDATGSMECFWGVHFGIIGRTATMQLDKMIVY